MICENIQDELERIHFEAEKRGIVLRLLGGMAISLHCPSSNLPALKRSYPDLDFATDRMGGQKVPRLFTELGYSADRNFNTLNGDRRLLFFDEMHHRQIDIFVSAFEMCHKLQFDHRLTVEKTTLPLAELFLTKAQIVNLNHKDILDLTALLLDHPIGMDDQETINQHRIVELCAKDWGWYATVNMTMGKLRHWAQGDHHQLDHSQVSLVDERIRTIETMVEKEPKSASWNFRARIGTRLRWYQEVEEVQR